MNKTSLLFSQVCKLNISMKGSGEYLNEGTWHHHCSVKDALIFFIYFNHNGNLVKIKYWTFLMKQQIDRFNTYSFTEAMLGIFLHVVHL